MGCGLRKLKPGSEEHSPGKIYSTLKRPQVETRAGPAYAYRFLDFLIGKDGGTSTLRLSSVRELPSQLQELYQQGFVLAALHPFIRPSAAGTESPEHQLYRAILVRHTDGGDRGPCLGPQHRLQLEECLSADQEPTPELIQGYVKKHIQDAADQGVLFVGFIQEAQSAPCRREPDTPSLSLSLHSSPSSALGSLGSTGPPLDPPDAGPEQGHNTAAVAEPEEKEEKEEEEDSAPCGSDRSTPRHNNNPETKDRPDPEHRGNGVELLALYNQPPVREPAVRYYTVKVPLSVQTSTEGQVCSLEGPWLDHLTQHYTSGASLVDGHFYLGHSNDLQSKAESVFIFQEPSESEAGAQPYDAIVVEQWTVIHGLQVKADYVPLLQSLASFGWRLTCVLPTPVIRTNSDGSLSTKQIVFLQRPVLSRKKKECKKLIFKSRSKPNKNCLKDSAKNKKSKRTEQLSEDAKTVDRPRDAQDANPAAARAESGADTSECNTDAKAPEDTPTAGEGQEEAKKAKDPTAVMENGIEADTEDQSTAGIEISAKDGRLTVANQSEAGSQEACSP